MAQKTLPGKLNRDSLAAYVEMHKMEIRVTGTALAASGMVMAASAATIDLNATIGPLIDAVSDLIPSLMNLVLALIPLMIVLAVAKFFPQLFDTILGWIKI
jgi:hypothetical protein